MAGKEDLEMTATLKTLSDSLETKQPQDILAVALDRYAAKIVLACSFGAEDVVLVDMVHRLHESIPIFYLDTDFLFPETYATRDRVVTHYGLKPDLVRPVKSLRPPERQASQFGDALWTRDPDHCCQLRKIEPLSRALEGYDAWITGIRRDQAPSRAQAGLIEWDA